MFETFDHTADLGLRVRAADLDTLFAEAALAMFSALVEDLSAVCPEQMIEVRIGGSDREYLLFDWLKELLVRFDVDHMLFSKFQVNVTDSGLEGKAWGEPLERSRHELAHEVKAITYHGLRVEKTTDGWLAEVIVDICDPENHHGEGSLPRAAGAGGRVLLADPEELQAGHARRWPDLRRRETDAGDPQRPGAGAGGQRRVPARHPAR